MLPHQNSGGSILDGKDLIYEGIATRLDVVKFDPFSGHGRKRPDLRRDCDISSCSSNPVGVFMDGKDLIYEGIATSALPRFVCIFHDGKDLIYEGIATDPSCGICVSGRYRRKRPDLRRDCDPPGPCIFETFRSGRKRPDLRRDCDCSVRIRGSCVAGVFQGRKRPDLRRDCDTAMRYIKDHFSFWTEKT